LLLLARRRDRRQHDPEQEAAAPEKVGDVEVRLLSGPAGQVLVRPVPCGDVRRDHDDRDERPGRDPELAELVRDATVTVVSQRHGRAGPRHGHLKQGVDEKDDQHRGEDLPDRIDRLEMADRPRDRREGQMPLHGVDRREQLGDDDDDEREAPDEVAEAATRHPPMMRPPPDGWLTAKLEQA
jgi:hypothetical protein